MKKLQELVDLAFSKGRISLVVASAQGPELMAALDQAMKGGLINAILVGDEDKIHTSAEVASFDLSSVKIVHEPDHEEACRLAVRMVRNREAKVLMKGNVRTDILVRSILDKENGLVSGSLLSHIAFFETPHYEKLLAVTDAALNIAPDLADKAAIVQNAVHVCRKLGISLPKVGILAAVEIVNEKMEATVHAAALKEMNRKGQIRNCIVDGPFALDNAVSAEAAKHKGIVSEVAGDVDVLVVPDLNSGNILYKSLDFLGGASAAAVLAGASAPVVLTSRSDSDCTKFFSIALAAALL